MKRKIGILLSLTIFVLSINVNLSFAVAAENAPVIKNVIYMIPDGGGFALFDFANGVKESGGFNAGLFPNSTQVTAGPMNLKNYLIGTETTHSASSSVTDSAAAGTALSSGYKTNNGWIGLTPQGVPRATILEAAQLAGKKTGIIATYPWHHATPASFTAHNTSRDNIEILSEQVVNQGLDVVLGAGFGDLQWGNINEAINRGYTIINNKQEMANVTSGTKIWGNIANPGFPYDIDLESNQTTLAEMTDGALRALDGGENGFFLMVEGSKVDGGGHANNILQAVSEYLAFDAAFKVALDYAKSRTDTVVMIAPDHDTGGLNLPNADEIGGNPNFNDYKDAIDEVRAGINSKNGILWTSYNHSARRGGVWMYAPAGVNPPEGLSSAPGDNAANRSLIIDNTKIAPYLADLIGVDLDDASNRLFVDVTSEGTFDENTNIFTFNNTDISIKANQSFATVAGRKADLNGEVAIYSYNKFYVPERLFTFDDKKVDFADARFFDETTGKVLVKGQIDKSFAGEYVSLMLCKKNTQPITKNDVKHIELVPVDRNGSYVFTFTISGNIDDYELKMFLGNELINDTIISASASYSWLDTDVKVYKADDTSLYSRLIINNHFNLEGLTYTTCLAFYDSNKKLVGSAIVTDIKPIGDGITTEYLAADFPAGTETVKAVVWSDFKKMIPISLYSELKKR